MNSKEVLISALILAAVASSACRGAARRAQAKREVAYQQTLQKYSGEFTAGMSRKEIEGRLQAQNIQFLSMCCAEERVGMDDLVKIGSEEHPWYCSEHNVYVAFEFTAAKPTDVFTASDADRLRKVTIFHWLEGCL